MAKKATNKQALTDWEEFKKNILSSTTVDDNETAIERQKRIAHLEANDEEWFAYYFPNFATAESAPFQKKATKRLFANDRWYEVRAWSRELAKSTRAMMEFLKLTLTDKLHNILLVSNSETNAQRLLKPWKLILEYNQRIINDYGPQKKFGDWEDGEFTTLGGCAFRAIGAGQSPRGSKNDNFRPDGIIIDDIDTDEECRNPEIIKNKWLWIEQALLPTVSISGHWRFLFNGNIIAKDCCITRAIKMADHVDIINIRDKNGKSSWKKNSEEDIDRLLGKLSSATIQKEYYNNPVVEGSIFKELTWGKIPPLNKFRFLVAYGDPAPSNKEGKSGCPKALWLVGMAEGNYYIITGYLDNVTNATYVEWYYNIDDYVKGRTQVYNYIENNSLQDPFFTQVYIPLFTAASQQRGKVIPIIPDTRKKPDKYARIEGNLEPLNRMCKLIFNEAEKGNPHMQRLEDQFKAFDAQMSMFVDGVDAVEGGVWIINNKNANSAADVGLGKKYTNPKRY